MLVRIKSVHNNEGFSDETKAKDKRIWGDLRELNLFSKRMELKYTDGSKRVRTTSQVCCTTIVGNSITVTTKNSVYRLEAVLEI